MQTRLSRIAVVVLGLGALVAGAQAQTLDRPTGVVQASAGAALARGATTIIGFLWSHDSAPIANGILRLRHLVSGRIEQSGTSSENGEFTFSDIEGGSYVVEYVDAAGKLLGVGAAFSVAPGETVATFVRLGTRPSEMSGFFGSIGRAVVASAAGLGVTAVAPTGRPISPNQ
jgi:hypothetical protein